MQDFVSLPGCVLEFNVPSCPALLSQGINHGVNLQHSPVLQPPLLVLAGAQCAPGLIGLELVWPCQGRTRTAIGPDFSTSFCTAQLRVRIFPDNDAPSSDSG